MKFLSGGQYDGENVPICTYWSTDKTTDATEELSVITSVVGGSSGNCIANAFFAKSTISCFNSGQCNGEGKCIVCTKYSYGGMRLGISHSPPLDVLRYYGRGMTEDELKSPNLVKFPPDIASRVDSDQLPLHILIRNVQAQVAKCCRWNGGDGLPGQFFVTKIISGPDSIEITDSNSKRVTIQGIRVKHSEFPEDETGAFFPVGTSVVAGFEDAPSFYLEPRTGLIKAGEGVIFSFTSRDRDDEISDNSPSVVQAKSIAAATSQIVIDAVNAVGWACSVARDNYSKQSSFLNNAMNTGDPATIAAATIKATLLQAAQEATCTAYSEAQTLGQSCIEKINSVVESSSSEYVTSASNDLVEELENLIVQVEIASNNAGDNDASASCQTSNSHLESQIRALKYYGAGGYSKCEFFSTEKNIASQWNTPTDGSLPCNGIRTGCRYYTGNAWKSATDENLEVGKPITAQQIQELRVRSDNWSRYSDPEAEFKKRFSTPFIWAFKDYVAINNQPSVEQMLLYRPKVLFARDAGRGGWETIRMTKVRVSNYTDFATEQSQALIQPGSLTEHLDGPPDFPTLIDKFTIPAVSRLEVTHPRSTDRPFVYRTWSPDKNKITLVGIGTPEAKLFIVNETALEQRVRYNLHFGYKNFTDNLPTSIPKAPDFVGLTLTELETNVIMPLREEKQVNIASAAPLGFYETTVGRDGFWYSFQDVDLVHNFVNTIYVFLVISETQILTESVQIDYRFLHSVIAQTEFSGIDFSMQSTMGSETGINAGDTVKKAKITASPKALVTAGGESPQFAFGYYAWRFKDRNLRFGLEAADNDLASDNPLLSELENTLVAEEGPSTFISNVSYQVVHYRKKDVEVSTWYLLNGCGYIMLVLDDNNLHRVLPLPDQTGTQQPLQNILVNGGVEGSETAQWALEEVKIRIAGETETKNMVQFYRDPDGFGLPANYVIVGPGTGSEDQFGRPDPTRDKITVTYVFLRPQSTNLYGAESAEAEGELVLEGNYEVISKNFYNDRLRYHTNTFSFDDNGVLTAGGERVFSTDGEESEEESESSEEIVLPIVGDQQDYVWVFADSTGRPIGKKYSRLLVMYYNMACINVEIFYSWISDCTTYALAPDLYLNIGTRSGLTVGAVEATTDPSKLDLGHRVANLLGSRECRSIPNCATHEFIALGPLRREFEVISEVPSAYCDATSEEQSQTGDTATMYKAMYPSAGGVVEGKIVSSRVPGSQFLRKRGPMWYPYTACERPRYDFRTNGPLRTDSTELINKEGRAPGISGPSVVASDVTSANAGCFEGLPLPSDEAYRGPDQVIPLILDFHPSLRNCTSGYTYGNRVLRSGETRFNGYARLRGEVDLSWFANRTGWSTPPFSNIGRPKLFFEVSAKRGDYIGGATGQQVGFRWMPLFPEREDLGANVSLFSEDIEPQHYRILAVDAPVGEIGEKFSEPLTKYTHKALIHNRTAGSIEYPYIPYYPSFLPDASLGEEPEEREIEGEEGSPTGLISTMWAWREQEPIITRGKFGNTILKGIELRSPDYFLDNRRLEVKLRPNEGDYILSWTPPTYEEGGKVKENAKLKLGGSGPEREILVDFFNKKFGIAFQGNTIYDTTKELGDTPFPCEGGTHTDNLRLQATCKCSGDVAGEGVDSTNLPSRFLHLDELAEDGFYVLYTDSDLRTPFAIDISVAGENKPCCMCMYYIPGIFFRINSEYIPSQIINSIANDIRIPFKYTWSRVPHGWREGVGVDGSFNANENLIDNLLDSSSGDIFTVSCPENRFTLSIEDDGVVVFPSPRLAEERITEENPIMVRSLPADSQRLKGGTPALDGISRGQSEQIGLTMVFETYLRIDEVKISFAAGVGWEIPTFSLGIIDPANRESTDFITTNTLRVIGSSLRTAVDNQIPDSDMHDADDIRRGRLKFVETLYLSYNNEPFWKQYGQQFQIIFGSRGNAQSLGIVSIEIKARALVEGSANTEIIRIPERKYYITTGSIPGGKNPEQYLGEQDSATVYWRTTEMSSFNGANKIRAYAWGNKINDSDTGNIRRSSSIQDLEKLQSQEFDMARDLMENKYFEYNSFVPKDEDTWRNFLIAYGAESPNWTLRLTQTLSRLEEVLDINGQPHFGIVPERDIFNPPGHMWTWKLTDETYANCCDGCPPQQLIDYEYLHLHDNLTVVETARFWDELPSGFTRIIRSTMIQPDPAFGQSTEAGINIDGSSSGRPVILDAGLFFDDEGNPISPEVLENAGISRNEEGDLVIIPQGEN